MKLDQIFSQMQFNALGFNEHFLRSLLYGLIELGGIGIASLNQKITATRINYFLFNMRWASQIHDKLDLSVTITQL
jgi:hypothetical protein